MNSVYVLSTGAYENNGVVGVFSTPEAAKAAVTEARPEDWNEAKATEYNGRTWWWSGEGKTLVSGRRGGMDACAHVDEYEVKGAS